MGVAEDEGERSSTLALHYLCAVPQLLDPNFHRSVVFMLEHSSEGSLGLVINNPMPTRVMEIASSLELDWRGDPEQRARLGGPVELTRGWLLHDQVEWDPNARTLLPGLQLTSSLEGIYGGQETFGGEGGRFMVLLGYAGWGGGQLEAEIAAGSWVSVPVQGVTCPDDGRGVPTDWLFEAHPHDMWADALRAIGADPERLVGLQGGGEGLH